MTTYTIFGDTAGPSEGYGYSGDWVSRVIFLATQGGCWLAGYGIWCCPTGQDTTPIEAALWQVTSDTTGILIPGSAATSGELTPGQWNEWMLEDWLALSPNLTYGMQVGADWVTGFPYTASAFAGYTSGPLSAPSESSLSLAQCGYSQAGSDPTLIFADGDLGGGNLWITPILSDRPPPGYSGSYQLWPNMPQAQNAADDSAANTQWSLGTEEILSATCTAGRLRFWSPPDADQLPTDCAIFDVTTQSIVAGTHNSSPDWIAESTGEAASAGDGWIYCAYSTTLPAGDYKPAVYNSAATDNVWSATTFPYWSGAGAGAAGITSGPVTAPNDADATSPGQSTYEIAASFEYPATYAAGVGSPNYWIELVVTPVAASGPGLLMACFP